jgi:hypothetical protein
LIPVNDEKPITINFRNTESEDGAIDGSAMKGSEISN